MGSSSRPDRRIAAVALGLALIASASCYWSKYDKLARTHVEVLLAMAAKIDDVVRQEGTAPAALGEYRYPLERARDFARIAGRRFEGRKSLVALRGLCDDYEQLLIVVERMRGAADPADESAALTAALATLRTAAAGVIAALDQEQRR